MTKAEVEKEAEEWLCNNLHSANEEDFIKAMVDIAEPREKRIAELETRCNELFLQTMQLTKAKEIIKKFSEFVNNEVEYDPEHPQEHTDLWNELCEEAEQFLNEVEK